MKKVFFLLLLASSIATKAQVVLTINNGDINLSTSTYTWSMKPLEYVDVNTTTGLVYVIGGGKQRDFYVKSLTSFTVNGAAVPITITNVKINLEANKTLGGAGGGAGDASAANQLLIRDGVRDSLNALILQTKRQTDSLVAINAKLRDKIITETYVSSTNATVTTDNATSSGTITAGKRMIMVANTGAVNGIFNGQTIIPGASITLPDLKNAKYGALTYNGTGTTLYIVTIQ